MYLKNKNTIIKNTKKPDRIIREKINTFLTISWRRPLSYRFAEQINILVSIW